MKKIEKFKKGISLIELIVVIGILSMMFISISNFIKSAKQYENNINVDYTGNSIMMFINRSKQYCKANNSNGLIVIDILKNIIKFYENNSKLVETFEPPKGIKLSRFSGGKKYVININDKGATSDACSIYYKDSEGIERRVTIRVGSEYTHVYE